MMPQKPKCNLFQVIAACRAPGTFTGRLYGRKQQPHQYADDGNDHENFYQGKSAPKRRASNEWSWTAAPGKIDSQPLSYTNA